MKNVMGPGRNREDTRELGIPNMTILRHGSELRTKSSTNNYVVLCGFLRDSIVLSGIYSSVQ